MIRLIVIGAPAGADEGAGGVVAGRTDDVAGAGADVDGGIDDVTGAGVEVVGGNDFVTVVGADEAGGTEVAAGGVVELHAPKISITAARIKITGQDNLDHFIRRSPFVLKNLF